MRGCDNLAGPSRRAREFQKLEIFNLMKQLPSRPPQA
jgi:hypothetical protein